MPCLNGADLSVKESNEDAYSIGASGSSEATSSWTGSTAGISAVPGDELVDGRDVARGGDLLGKPSASLPNHEQSAGCTLSSERTAS